MFERMDKEFILEEIRRTAAMNGGQPLGIVRFERETGIRRSDWHGKHWRGWGDALQEAGFNPNQLKTAYEETYLLEKFIDLIRELNRFPAAVDLQMKASRDEDFPSRKVFNRLGNQAERRRKVREYCQSSDGYEDILELCPAPPVEPQAAATDRSGPPEVFGSVYLLKWGRYYKIGKTNSLGRRERELAIQLPEKATLVHEIRTDDPAGIEAYWHRRFADKHKHGEWFELTAEDVAAFKRRKFM